MVIPLGAGSHVDRSIDGLADFIHTNINGVFTLLKLLLLLYYSDQQKLVTDLEFFQKNRSDSFCIKLPLD